MLGNLSVIEPWINLAQGVCHNDADYASAICFQTYY